MTKMVKMVNIKLSFTHSFEVCVFETQQFAFLNSSRSLPETIAFIISIKAIFHQSKCLTMVYLAAFFHNCIKKVASVFVRTFKLSGNAPR